MKEFVKISAKDNPLIKLTASLQGSAKARRESGLFVIEGLRICLDAEENSVKFKNLIVTESALEKYSGDIERMSIVSEKCAVISDSLFKKISDTSSPQGIIALGEIPQKNSALEKSGKYLAFENLADPSNLGAAARTAEALGLSGIILNSSGCDPYSPKVLRASMGTILRLPLFVVENTVDFIKENGLRCMACVVDKSARKITDVSFSGGDAVLIGNEANGLSEYAKASADCLITIPMLGRAESLNASVAAAIAAWEMMRG